MKYLKNFSTIFLCMTLCFCMLSTSQSSYLKIDIVEAVNLHCKLNDEFYCNPYAIVQFKYSEEKRTTKRIECTKNPKWESDFTFEPEYCHEVVYIYFYQYLTPRDTAYIGSALTDEDRYEKGEISPGYLGRVVLELEKLPFGTIDDWFMIESPVENTRIMFPSCLHLRISWTSSTCSESSPLSQYQIDSIKTGDEELPEKFEPRNFIPMCKKDFAMVYKTKFSRIDRDGQVKNLNEMELIDDKSKKELHCKVDINQDYGFLHSSNLTAIEEALVFKIIKRTTGENINYEEFTKDFPNTKHKYIKSYKDFFEKECFKKMDLTIERINSIIKNDAEKFPDNTTNPYLTIKTSDLEYSLLLNHNMMKKVYNDTLDQFYALEDIKNLDKMEEDTYVQTLNKMVEVMRDIKAEKKIDSTLFYLKNKVMLTNEGRVHPKEELFFRIYALYKWNGGKFGYDEIKREYMLRRKYFYCYEIVKVMPTNIIFQFVEDVCPDNYVCVDPNGIVISSEGRDPRKVFKTEIEKNGINFFMNTQNNKMFENQRKVTNLRFKSLSTKIGNDTEIKPISEEDRNVQNEEKSNNDIVNFDKLLKMEENVEINSPGTNLPLVLPNQNKDEYTNKFDFLYKERRVRIEKKKEIIINKVFNLVPLIGEILAMVNIKTLGSNINKQFLERETNLMKKYLLLYDATIPFVEKAASLLVDLILCNTDKNKLRYVLQEMLEGLCFGDDRSIKIFMEIVRTTILDSLLTSPLYSFEQLHAKVNLAKALNKPFCFKTITKIRFIEGMLMLDYIKEKITYIIWNNETNKKIAMKIQETEGSIPITLPNNKRLFSYNPIREFDNAREVNRNSINEMMRLQKWEDEENLKHPGEFSFKSINKNEIDVDEDDIVKKMQKLRKQLDDDVNYESLRDDIIKEPENLISDIKSTKGKNSTNHEDLMEEFGDFIEGMHFKEMEEKVVKKEENVKKVEKINKKLLKNIDTKNPKFQSINFDDDDSPGLLSDNLSSNEFAKVSLNQYNNPHIYQRQEPSSSILTTTRNPSQAEILEKVMKDPETRKIIEQSKSHPGNKVLFPKEIHTTYEVNRRGTKEITVNENNPTKKLILDKLMDESTFNDMMSQDESNKVDDQTGLYNVLKNIQNKKCSCDYLCIEIGTIYGPFDSLKPKNVTIMTNHRENVQVIIKPVILVNNTIDRTAPMQNISGLFDNEDCDILKMSSNPNTNLYQQNIRFKQLVDKHKDLSRMKRKFYRKVEYGNEILATEIFKQGLNVIILKREKGYQKIYERTFNTNVDPVEADAMACVIRDAGFDKIVVITAIGKWMGSITPRLVKEIKQIGGPDLNRLVSVDSEDNSMMDHAFILIGRKGLCRYNGLFRVKNYDISRDLKRYFPDISSDPNDCYFDNLTFENEKNKHSENQFFHLVDLRLTLNLMNDNRFSYLAPIIKSVSPISSPLNGGACVQIEGENFGNSPLNIKEVLIKGVVCRNVELVSPRLISCTTGSSMIMGPGVGNIQVKLINGLSSPTNTCNMFQYTNEESLNADVPAPTPLPIHRQVHVIQHVIPSPLPLPRYQPTLFSFKEKKIDENGNPDHTDIINSIKNKVFAEKNPNNSNVQKIDNLVTDNFKNLLNQANTNGFNIPKDGFRKKRFQKIINQLK